MAKFRVKKKWKSILFGVLAIALVVASVAGLASMLGREEREIGNTKFSVGAIGANGQFVDFHSSIVSDYIECQGLRIEPKADATAVYQVFYYAEDKSFYAATDKMTPQDGIYEVEPQYSIAKYVRIVITPAVPLDEDGYAEENFRIRFYEVGKYADEFTISVPKKQKYVNLYDDTKATYGLTFDDSGYDSFIDVVKPSEVADEVKVSAEIPVTGAYKSYDVYVKSCDRVSFGVNVALIDVENSVRVGAASIDQTALNAALSVWHRIVIEVPDTIGEEAYLRVRLPSNAECVIVGVK